MLFQCLTSWKTQQKGLSAERFRKSKFYFKEFDNQTQIIIFIEDQLKTYNAKGKAGSKAYTTASIRL